MHGGLSAQEKSVVLVNEVGDKFVVLGREVGEVHRLLQHSGILGVGLSTKERERERERKERSNQR